MLAQLRVDYTEQQHNARIGKNIDKGSTAKSFTLQHPKEPIRPARTPICYSLGVMNIIPNKPAPSVAILYGFCEGPKVARKFRRACTAAGFRLTTDATRADIIIAHSGGCFLIPPNTHAKLIVLIGVPFWPGKPLPHSVVQKVRADLHEHRDEKSTGEWLEKLFWNGCYVWRMDRNVRMARGHKQGRAWVLPPAKTLVIRNAEDTLCTPHLSSLPFEHMPAFCELPGQHDDCWHHPEMYVGIVQSEYATRLLAQTSD